jgi:hypothetical protein
VRRFVRNALDDEINRAIAEAIDEIFGPEPAEDDGLPSGRPY